MGIIIGRWVTLFLLVMIILCPLLLLWYNSPVWLLYLGLVVSLSTVGYIVRWRRHEILG